MGIMWGVMDLSGDMDMDMGQLVDEVKGTSTELEYDASTDSDMGFELQSVAESQWAVEMVESQLVVELQLVVE